MMPDIIDSLVDNGYKGIIIAGTGLGHINKPLYPAIERAVAKGVHIFMCVQTLWGFAHMDGKQDYDVLGFIYEYLISMFAANAGKKAGEFYTPHEVSLLMSEIVADHGTSANWFLYRCRQFRRYA